MRLIATLTILALSLASAPAAANIAQSQRDAFRTALPKAEAGRWDEVESLLHELEDYPLLPDLRAAWLRGRLGRIDDAEVKTFLQQHPDFGFSAGLRWQWANSLARRSAWAEYLELYQSSYADSGNVVLDCHALAARIKLDRDEGLEAAALQRWLAPASQPKECDPAFEWLEARGALTAERRRQRMELALEAGQLSLARWLARPLGEPAVREVSRWEQVNANPAAQLVSPERWSDTPRQRALLLSGFHRMASTDPDVAAQRWPAFRDRFGFSAVERAMIDQRIALIHAWRHLPDAGELLAALPESSHNADTRAWRVRIAIRAQDWPAIEKALALLQPEESGEPVWRYWQARVLESTGRSDQARPIYAALAAERGYYSFLSADRLGADYNWKHVDTSPDEELLTVLESRPDIIRARELFFTGLEANGRVEWQRVLIRLEPAPRAQAGILAHRWGWYSRAITAATSAGLHDDLGLRFPLPWRPVFEEHSERNGLNSAWTYGIARSESLFVPDARSGAGAVGLMQLMPGTGKETARRAGIAFRGQQTLLDPVVNVALGTTYLAEMMARFGNHRVLATAAYNAGPGRVDRWLPEQEALSADAWVDSIPFTETRGYVQRVLASEAVFQWRLSGETSRLSDAMQGVASRAD